MEQLLSVLLEKKELFSVEGGIIMDFQDYKGVWVFIEEKDGVIPSVSLELLGAGRKLANKRGVELAGILIGENIKHLAKTVFEYGADITYVYDQPIFKHYRTESFMKALLECANKYKPEIILFRSYINWERFG